MSWRAEHKIACQQIKVSSLANGPNKNGTTSLESRKGHNGLKFICSCKDCLLPPDNKNILNFLDEVNKL